MYPNLPRNVIVRQTHPRSRDTKCQAKFFTNLATMTQSTQTDWAHDAHCFCEM